VVRPVVSTTMAHMRACTRVEKLMANPQMRKEMKTDPEGKRLYWWYYSNCDIQTPEEKEKWEHALDNVGPDAR
jgi:hypothetical protein